MNESVAFVNVDEKKSYKKNNKKKKELTCYKCSGKDHYAHNCPSTTETIALAKVLANNGIVGTDEEEEEDSDDDFAFVSYGVLCNQVDNNNLPKSWILLYNQSTVDVFHNKDLLKNIQESGESMTIHCNAGTKSTHLIGELPGYGTIWYHPNVLQTSYQYPGSRKDLRLNSTVPKQSIHCTQG